MESLLLTFHVLVCIVLMVAILLQAGKGASIGAAFGGGGSNTMFGNRGPATFFQKFTTVTAVLFLATSIGLARNAKIGDGPSVIDTTPGLELPAEPAAASTDTSTEAAAADTSE